MTESISLSLVFWKRPICTEHWKAWKILKQLYVDAISCNVAEPPSEPDEPDPGDQADWGDADINAAPGTEFQTTIPH